MFLFITLLCPQRWSKAECLSGYHPQGYCPPDSSSASGAPGCCDSFCLPSFTSVQREDVWHPHVDPGQLQVLWTLLVSIVAEPKYHGHVMITTSLSSLLSSTQTFLRVRAVTHAQSGTKLNCRNVLVVRCGRKKYSENSKFSSKFDLLFVTVCFLFLFSLFM